MTQPKNPVGPPRKDPALKVTYCLFGLRQEDVASVKWMAAQTGKSRSAVVRASIRDAAAALREMEKQKAG